MDAVTTPTRAAGTDDEAPPARGGSAASGMRRVGEFLRTIVPTRPWLQFVVFFVLLTLALVVIRGDLLWTSGMQNPDEAELLAEGRSAAQNLFPYSGYTTSTHLFLWPVVLGLLDLLGVPMTLVTAHVLGGLSYVFLGTTGWFLVMRRLGGVRATLLVLPTTLVLLMGYGPGTADFLSLTSESLPAVVLCVAALVMLGPRDPLTARRLFIGSLFAGLAMWAKPQSGPVAAMLVAACVVMGLVETRRSEGAVRWTAAARAIIGRGALALLAFAAPTILFVGAMAAGGTLGAFAREPLAAMWGYAADRDETAGIVAPELPERLAGLASFATSFPFALAWALGGLLATSGLTRLRSPLLRVLGLVAFLLPLAATFLCLVPIYPLFPHYANLLYVGCLLATCVAVRLTDPGQDPPAQSRWVEGTYGGLVLAVIAMLMLPTVPDNVKDLAVQSGHALTGRGFDFHNEVPRDKTPLGTDCAAGSRVLVWGWASELYAFYDWTPASRYANATWIVNPNANQVEYARVLRGELDDDPPRCIVEALGPAFFSGIDPSRTLASVVPQVSSLLESCYRRSDATTFDGRTVTLYLRTPACASS